MDVMLSGDEADVIIDGHAPARGPFLRAGGLIKALDAVGAARLEPARTGLLCAEASSLDEARALVTGADHMSLETIVVSDGETQRAEVLEMAPARVSTRGLADGVVTSTNHFAAGDMDTLDRDPPPEHSVLRHRRLEQLVPRHGSQSLFGRFGPHLAASVLRDRVNPDTGVESPADVFLDEQSIATNGALYSMIFDPAGRRFWLAAGAVPLHAQPLLGLSLGELLDWPDASPVPATIP